MAARACGYSPQPGEPHDRRQCGTLPSHASRAPFTDIPAPGRASSRHFKACKRHELDSLTPDGSGKSPVGRALTPEEQRRLLEAAASNPEWEHVYCAAVLAANISMRRGRGQARTPARHRPRESWDLENATGKGVLYVTKSKNESSKRVIPLNRAAREAVERMLRRADSVGHTNPDHHVWCASQHHKFNATKPASKWDGAWHSLRKSARSVPSVNFKALLRSPSFSDVPPGQVHVTVLCRRSLRPT